MENRNEKLEELLKYMAEQFVMLITNNNHLLEENLKLMKENERLNKDG